jgi:hypothetical protein
MRRVIAIATAGLGLAGCSSMPSMSASSFDPMAEPPRYVQLQVESAPQGAEARTSTGQACTTPCAITLTNPETGFLVSYALNGFQPMTIPVQITRTPSSFWSWGPTTANPNPVVAQLQPVPPPPPPPKPVRKRPKSPAAPKPAPAPPAAGSPFPAPQASPPQATPPPASSR